MDTSKKGEDIEHSKDGKHYGCGVMELPEDFDPYDMALKKKLNPKADEKNFIHVIRNHPALCCGAKKVGDGKGCRKYAGLGTSHVGWGRCRQHGGSSPGPLTAEGKANLGHACKHGLYSKALMPNERAAFDELLDNPDGELLTLKHEILVYKAKLITYLAKWSTKWEEVAEKEGEGPADSQTRIWYNEGENGRARNCFQAGTIEDRTLDRALNTLRRMVDTYNKLNPPDSDSLLSQINSELQAASHGAVQVSWGGKAQRKKAGGDSARSGAVKPGSGAVKKG